MQFIIRKMTLTDLIYNIFYKLRYTLYRRYIPSRLCSYSSKEKEGWNITFEDDFDKESWSSTGEKTKWEVGEFPGMFHPDKRTVYYGPPELNGDSTAKFTVKYKPKTYRYNEEEITFPFEVSLLSSRKSLKQQYGRFECRMTLPFTIGAWPAFWIWGDTWPPEIDIYEAFGGPDGKMVGRNKFNIHYGSIKEGNRSSIKGWPIWIQTDQLKRFHEFAVEWYDDKILLFINGIKVFRITNKNILEWFNKETSKQRIIINHSLQEKYGGELRGDYEGMDLDYQYDKDYTSEFFVDYIRAYKRDI